MGLVPDSSNEELIRRLLAERAQLQARVRELTVELECRGQYGTGPLIAAAPNTAASTWGLPWSWTAGSPGS